MPKKNKTILFASQNLTWNRAPVFAALSQSDRFDIKFMFFKKRHYQKYHYDQGKLLGYLVEYLEKNNVCFVFRYGWQSLHYLLTEDYDVLVGGGWDSREDIANTFFFFLASIVRRKKFVLNNYDRWRKGLIYNSHDQWTERLMANIKFIKKYLFLKCIFLKVDKVAVSGKKHRDFIKLWGFKDKDITIITQCSQVWLFSERFDLEQYFQNRETFKIGFLGRCDLEIKGIQYLMEAFEMLNRKFDNIELFLVGHKSNTVSKNVYELQSIPPEQVHHFYKSIDLVAVPSIEERRGAVEAWGYIINEAYQFGVPVVATNTVGCVDDIVTNHDNGFVAKEKDADDLAEKIEILIRDKALCEKISSNNKALFNERLTHEKNTKAWEDFFSCL